MTVAFLGPLLLTAVVQSTGLTTGYINEIRADLALADRIVVKASPENGGGMRTVTDPATLRALARHIPRNSIVRRMDGKLGIATYVVLEIYETADAKDPLRSLTVTPKKCMFHLDEQAYEFTSDNAAFYAAVVEFAKRR